MQFAINTLAAILTLCVIIPAYLHAPHFLYVLVVGFLGFAIGYRVKRGYWLEL